MPMSFHLVIGQLLLCGCAVVVLGCGEMTAPADGGGQAKQKSEDDRPPIYKRLPRHPRMELSNLHFGTGNFDHETFQVDWRVLEGSASDVNLIIRTPQGAEHRMMLGAFIEQKSGTVGGEMQEIGIGKRAPRLQSGCEMFLAAQEGTDYESPLFKVSDSLTTGNASRTIAQTAPPELRKAPQKSPGGSDKPETSVAAADPGQSSGRSAASGRPNASSGSDRSPRSSAADPSPARRPRSRPSPRPAEEADLVAVPENLEIPRGTSLRAEWARKWLPVTALEPSPSGGIKIHWEGYSSGFDKTLPRSKLRIERARLADLQAGRSPQAERPAPSREPSASLSTADRTAESAHEAALGRYVKALARQYGAENVVVVRVTGIKLGFAARLRRQLQKATRAERVSLVGLSPTKVAFVLAPLSDHEKLAEQISFGKVTGVDSDSRTISVRVEGKGE